MIPGKETSHTQQDNKKSVRYISLAGALLLVFGVGVLIGTVTFSGGARVDGAAQISTSLSGSSLSTFWRVWDLLEEKYPFSEKPGTEEKLDGAIEGLVESYGDPYTIYFPPEESKLFLSTVKGELNGVGMEVGERGGYITVIAPLVGSPAEKSGVLSGDIIFAIDDVATEGMSIDAAVALIRGEPGTTVRLTIIREGEPKEIIKEIKRDTIQVPILATREENGAFIIELYSFTENSADLFKEALLQFEKSKSKYLVLDLRNNPGGFLDSATDIASFFLLQGTPIVRESFGAGKKETIFRSKGEIIITRPYEMAILVNRGSASASEILAGALSEEEKAILVGEKTFGKGLVQELINLPRGASLKITVAEWLTPKGVSISKEGLTPDFEATDDLETEKDEVLSRAIFELRK